MTDDRFKKSDSEKLNELVNAIKFRRGLYAKSYNDTDSSVFIIKEHLHQMVLEYDDLFHEVLNIISQ